MPPNQAVQGREKIFQSYQLSTCMLPSHQKMEFHTRRAQCQRTDLGGVAKHHHQCNQTKGNLVSVGPSAGLMIPKINMNCRSVIVNLNSVHSR